MEYMIPQKIEFLNMSIDKINSLLSDYLKHVRQKDRERRKERGENASKKHLIKLTILIIVVTLSMGFLVTNVEKSF